MNKSFVIIDFFIILVLENEPKHSKNKAFGNVKIIKQAPYYDEECC